jgi:hypothetical protein
MSVLLAESERQLAVSMNSIETLPFMALNMTFFLSHYPMAYFLHLVYFTSAYVFPRSVLCIVHRDQGKS